MNKSKFLHATILANQEVCRYVKQNHISDEYIPLKAGYGGDISTVFDIKAESIFVKHLGHFGKIVSEESGIIGDGEATIVIDPLDGSENMVSHFPYYGSSVALFEDNALTFGAVANFPSEELFVRGDGSLQKSNLFNIDFKDVLIHSASKVGIFEKASSNIEIVKKLVDKQLKFRSPGAVALSIANAHSVNYVLFVGSSREFDIDAGWHMCEGLYRFRNEQYVLISKSRDIFNQVKEIMDEEQSWAL